MISILIPTYNHNICALVNKVHEQIMILNITFEIIVMDDSSANTEIIYQNKSIEDYINCKYIYLKKNIGRSKIRNLLAEKSKYNWLLFLDADVMIEKESYISNYFKAINKDHDIIYGGLQYNLDTKSTSLRATAGKKREAINYKERNTFKQSHFLFSNVLLKKEVFNSIKFDESITSYGHEDTVFQYNSNLKKHTILHIDNSVLHTGIESNAIYLSKVQESLNTLFILERKNKLPHNYTKIQAYNSFLKKYYLRKPFIFISNLLKYFILINLKSKNPSLILFDIFKLNYFSSLTSQQNA